MRHAAQTMDFPAGTGITAWSRPFGMWIGNIELGSAPNNEVIAVVGTRLYDPTDYDSTLTQLMANDSIYADQFGGTKND